jgi:hypothetical protein
MRALILAGFIVLSNFSFSADPPAEAKKPVRDHGKPGAIENAKSGPREIPDYLLKYISSTFDLPISYVKERWKDDGLDGPDSLMSAVRDMEKGDDTRIAKILAQLIGTLNPASSEAAFKKTRDLFIAESTNPTPRMPYANLMERVMFGLYAWPTDKTKAPAFCQKPVAAVKKAEQEATVHTKWEGDLDGAYAKALQGDKDKKPGTEEVNKAIAEECFGQKDGKFTNEAYGKFWEKFDPAASEVFAKNEEYHKKTDEFSTAKDEATKAKLAQEISAKWNQDALSAYAGQQSRSGWAEEKDGKKVAEVRADAALRVAAWAQNGFAKPTNFVLKDPTGTEVSIEVKPDVLMGVALKEKIAELAQENKITKPEVGPYDLRPAAAKPVVAQTQPTGGQQGTGQQQQQGGANTPMPPAATFGYTIADGAKGKMVNTAQNACVACHTQKNNAGKRLPLTFTPESLKSAVEQHGMLGDNYLKGKITEPEMSSFKAWLVKEGIKVD